MDQRFFLELGEGWRSAPAVVYALQRVYSPLRFATGMLPDPRCYRPPKVRPTGGAFKGEL